MYICVCVFECVCMYIDIYTCIYIEKESERKTYIILRISPACVK